MRIGIFQPSFVGAGGVERVIAETVKRMPEHKWTFYGLRYDRENVERFFPQMRGVGVAKIPALALPGPFPSRFRRPEIYNLLDSWSYRWYLSTNRINEDVVIAHLSFATVVALYARVPAIWYCHCATRYLYEDWVQKEMEDLIGPAAPWAKLIRNYLREREMSSANKFTKIICNSKHTQNKLRMYFNLEADVIYPGVEIPADTGTFYGNCFIVPSRLNYYKRVDIAIKAMDYLRDIPGARLKVIGNGMAKENLKVLARDMGLTSVDFSDPVPDLSPEYRNCLGVVYLSRDEDFGIVPVEAMSYRKPVIAADEGGLRETVIDGKTGFLVRPDPESVAARMRQLYFDRDKASEMGEAGRTWASEFSWDRHVEQLRKAVEGIV